MSNDKLSIITATIFWGMFIRPIFTTKYENPLLDSKKHYAIRNHYFLFDQIDIRDRQTDYSIKREYSFLGKYIPFEFQKNSFVSPNKLYFDVEPEDNISG